MQTEESRVLLALGENWAKGKHGSQRALSLDSIRTTQATAILLASGKFHTVIFSTGYTNGPKQIAEADAMADLLTYITPDRAQEVQIIRETRSFDTPTNMQETKQILETEGLTGPITLVAPKYHLRRARRIAKGYGIPIAESIPAEKVLGVKPRRAPITEYPLRLFSMFDKSGIVPRVLWTKRRTR